MDVHVYGPIELPHDIESSTALPVFSLEVVYDSRNVKPED